MTWNEDRERLIAAAELGDTTPRIAADLLVAARKRAFEAEHKAQQLQTELDALKAAHAWIKTSERMPEPEVVVLVVSTQDYAEGEVCTAKCYTSPSGVLHGYRIGIRYPLATTTGAPKMSTWTKDKPTPGK